MRFPNSVWGPYKCRLPQVISNSEPHFVIFFIDNNRHFHRLPLYMSYEIYCTPPIMYQPTNNNKTNSTSLIPTERVLPHCTGATLVSIPSRLRLAICIILPAQGITFDGLTELLSLFNGLILQLKHLPLFSICV